MVVNSLAINGQMTLTLPGMGAPWGAKHINLADSVPVQACGHFPKPARPMGVVGGSASAGLIPAQLATKGVATTQL